MKKERTQKKRYGLLLTLLCLSWLLLGWMVWKVDPETIKNFIVPGVYLPMLFSVFGAVFLLLSILFLSAKRALRWSLGITVFLLLRFLDFGSVFNGTLIVGMLLSFEIYSFKFKNKEVDNSTVV